MFNRFLFLSDLDHTLFQSHRADATGTLAMTVDAQGNPHGYARQDQQDMFAMMIEEGIVVPVTARSHQQMERVTGWVTGQDYDLAITDLGANLLLRDNNGDSLWHAVESWSEPYVAIAKERTPRLVRDYQLLTETFLPQAEMSEQVEVDLIRFGKLDIPLYITLSLKGDAFGLLHEVVERFAKPLAKLSGIYTLHVSENVVCLWPDYVSKASAVTRLLAIAAEGSSDTKFNLALNYLNLTERSIVTMGDSATDAEFMLLGHMMLTPTNSEIAGQVKAAQPSA